MEANLFSFFYKRAILIVIVFATTVSTVFAQFLNINYEYNYNEIVAKSTNGNLGLLKEQIKQLEDFTEKYSDNGIILSKVYDHLLRKKMQAFCTTKELFEIWDAWYEIDKYTACREFSWTIDELYLSIEHKINQRTPYKEFFIREFEKFKCDCQGLDKYFNNEYIKTLIRVNDKMFWEKENLNEKDINDVLDILEKIDQYPGRNIVGLSWEHVVIDVLLRTDVSTIEKYLPMIKQAVVNETINPRHYATILDAYLSKKGMSQVYYTNSDGELNLTKEDLIEINNKRFDIGLPRLGSNSSFLGELLKK